MESILFNDGFTCKVLKYEEEALKPETGRDEAGYSGACIPHDALIEDISGLYEDHVIWYRKVFSHEQKPGKRYFFYFDGVYMDVSVYVNGVPAMRWVNGYTSFYFEATEYLVNGENELMLSIDYRCPNARWYAGPGITRNVWLLVSDEDCFVPDSLYVSAKPQDSGWSVKAFIQTDTHAVCKKDRLRVRFIIDDEHSAEAVCKCINAEEYWSAELYYNDPVLWDTEAPGLYCMRAELYSEGELCDTASSDFGFRSIELDPDRGLFLNGRHLKLQGVCIHSDYGAFGSAFQYDAAKRQLSLLKDMGANAVRLCHNVFAPEMMELCDRLGLLVLSEALDCWRISKNPYDYGRFFDEWAEKDIASWVRRDRNHPSLFMFSAGNEIYDTHAGPEGKETLSFVVKEIRRHDFLENAFITLCSNYMAWENTREAVKELKICGYNYGEGLYEEHHRMYPDWCIFGSETASLVMSRGVYHFPYDRPLLSDDDMQCSSLGNSRTSWGAKSMDFCAAFERDHDFSLGQFIWAGIDYIGEPTPYHTKNSYFGLLDTALFPKDVYYMLKSVWNRKAGHFVHLYPWWDFNEGQEIDVLAASTAERIVLYLNGEKLGERVIDHEHGDSFLAHFRVRYAPGCLKAVGYDVEGNEVASDTQESFSDVCSLSLSESSFEVEENDSRVRFVTVKGLDKNGRFVGNGRSRVNINVEGPAELVGLDNGDSTDTDSYKGSSKRLFNGLLSAMIRPVGRNGRVRISAQIDTRDIPVRKIELICKEAADEGGKKTAYGGSDRSGIRHIYNEAADEGGKDPAPSTPGGSGNAHGKGDLILNRDRAEIVVGVRVYPENARGYSLEYQITNESGTIDNRAVCEPVKNGVKVRALCDGGFLLRALCREESGRVTCISTLSFTAEGIGRKFVDPYKFVFASLCDERSGDIGNGNEKGISTSRYMDSWVLFKGVDFKEEGSDKVTIPIFELDSEKTELTIWDGRPHEEGSEIILNAYYEKPSVWNVYQEETYTLTMPLKGLHDIAFETHSHKIHMKGFVFEKYDPTYRLIHASEAKRIYGDSYRLEGEAVLEIGNNVTLSFTGFDFKDGIRGIKITGRTPLLNNTIHLISSDEEGSHREIIEFAGPSDFEERYFELPDIRGKKEISLLFLPGSSFDLRSFVFIRRDNFNDQEI